MSEELRKKISELDDWLSGRLSDLCEHKIHGHSAAYRMGYADGATDILELLKAYATETESKAQGRA